jgi:hypothetical protein
MVNSLLLKKFRQRKKGQTMLGYTLQEPQLKSRLDVLLVADAGFNAFPTISK